MTTPANFNQVTTTGSTYLRANRVVMLNPLGGPQQILLDEEKVHEANGAPVSAQPTMTLSTNVDLVNGSIPLLDMTTGQPTGQTMSHLQVFQAMYSLYVQLASARATQP